MEDSACVRPRERVGEFDRHRHGVGRDESPPRREERFDGLPLEEVHGDIGRPVSRFAGVDDVHDARVTKLAEDMCLAKEALLALLPGGAAAGAQCRLEGDAPVRDPVQGVEDHAL